MNKYEFAKILKNSREEKNVTQHELACKTGLTERSIIYWEQGVKSISLQNAGRRFLLWSGAGLAPLCR